MNEFNIGEKLISGIERFDSLPRSDKNLGFAALAVCTGIITELNNETFVLTGLCAAVAACYLGRATRTYDEDRSIINPED